MTLEFLCYCPVFFWSWVDTDMGLVPWATCHLLCQNLALPPLPTVMIVDALKSYLSVSSQGRMEPFHGLSSVVQSKYRTRANLVAKICWNIPNQLYLCPLNFLASIPFSSSLSNVRHAPVPNLSRGNLDEFCPSFFPPTYLGGGELWGGSPR